MLIMPARRANPVDIGSYFALIAPMPEANMFDWIRDWHETLSWKLGYGRGKEGRAYSCPWWVDKVVYGTAYMQGCGVQIPPHQPN
jgi:hypothetical protein